jgi:hypothetical protein
VPHIRIRSRHQPFEIAILATAPVRGILLIGLAAGGAVPTGDGT